MHSQRQAKTGDKATQLRRSSTLNKTNSPQTPINHPGAILQQTGASPSSTPPGQLLQLQRAIGNQAVGQLIQRQVPEEDEELLQGRFSDSVQRQTVEEDEETLQGRFVDQDNQANLTGMPDDVKAKMEGAFNTRFSDVRLYPNSGKAIDVGSLAYTKGSDIHFAPGEFNADSLSGQKLLGHELTHVMQQREGRVKPTGSINGLPLSDSPSLEKEADVVGKKALQSNMITEKSNKGDKSRAVANGVRQMENTTKQGDGVMNGRPPVLGAVMQRLQVQSTDLTDDIVKLYDARTEVYPRGGVAGTNFAVSVDHPRSWARSDATGHSEPRAAANTLGIMLGGGHTILRYCRKGRPATHAKRIWKILNNRVGTTLASLLAIW